MNFSRQEHQIDVLYVSFNAWDSQVSSYTPFHFSFTVPLRISHSKVFSSECFYRLQGRLIVSPVELKSNDIDFIACVCNSAGLSFHHTNDNDNTPGISAAQAGISLEPASSTVDPDTQDTQINQIKSWINPWINP